MNSRLKSPSELFVARFGLPDRDDWVSAAEQWLSAVERDSAARFTDSEARAQHVVGRAIVHILGGRASGLDPAAVAVAVTKERKPYLADLPDVQVSIAHSRGVVAVASVQGAPLGVDVEAVDEASRGGEGAVRRFAKAEQAHFAGIAPGAFANEFTRYWTIKEAVGKALGVGVMPALHGVVVEAEGDRLRLLEVPSGPPAGDWTLHQLAAPGGDELIAVAIAAPRVELAPVRRFELAALRGGVLPPR